VTTTRVILASPEPTGKGVGATSGKEKAAAPEHRRFLPPQPELKLVRDVGECRAELGADALHRANGGDGDQRRDETIFNGRRALLVLNQLHELGHFRSPTWLRSKGKGPRLRKRNPRWLKGILRRCG